MRLPWPLLVYTAAVLITVWCSDGQVLDLRVRLLMPAFPPPDPSSHTGLALAPARRRRSWSAAACMASAVVGGYALTIWRYAI